MTRCRSALKVVEHQGLLIHCDRPVGTTITGTDPSGKPYSVTYSVDYGFLPGVKGDDGEDYDAYVGPVADAGEAHIVRQLKPRFGRYDEQKAMLGFASASDAEATYRAHTHPAMFGGIASMPLKSFKDQLDAYRAGDKAAPFRAETDTAMSEEAKHAGPSDTLRTDEHRHALPTDTGQAVSRPAGLCVRAAELSAVREDAREVDFVMSTGKRDSYGEIVRQNWRLDRFRGNPVALWAHKSGELPIGYWTNVRVDAGALRGTLKIVTEDANPFAEKVLQSYVQKSLRAVSVGFMPGKVVYEEVDGEETCFLDDNELYECSPVPIPANPEALIDLKARAKAAFAEHKELMLARADTSHAPHLKPPSAAQTSSPARAHDQEPRMAQEDTTKNIDELVQRKVEVIVGERVKTAEDKVKTWATEQIAARDALVKTAQEEAASAKGTNVALQKRLLELELQPLMGVKFAPEELDGHTTLGALWRGQGPDGEKRWENHLKGLATRPDLATRPGGSVLPKEASIHTTLGAGIDSTDVLLGAVEKAADFSLPVLSA